MDREALTAYCAAKRGVTSDLPFGDDTLVFRVGGKIFALIALNAAPLRVNLKCEPALAEILRQTYSAVIPGYHMNKRHWNTVVLDGSLPDTEVREMIDNSYDLVFNSLPRAQREALSKS